jgi:hypothetical protein
MVVAVNELDFANLVVDATGGVEVNEGSTLGEPTSLLAEAGVVGIGADRVHPELGRTSIKLKLDRLAWGTDCDIDGIECAEQLVLQADIGLSLGEALHDRGANRTGDGKSEDARIAILSIGARQGACG